jgi:hypothetical protein
MSDASPAKRRNSAAILGICFVGAAVALPVGVGLAAVLAATVTVPDFVGKIANANLIVVNIAVVCLCVAAILFGVVGIVRGGRLGGRVISTIVVAVSGVLLVVSALIVVVVSALNSTYPGGGE